MMGRRVLGAVVVAALLGELVWAGTAYVSAEPTAPRFVREAQRVLEDLGYRPGPIDGIVGPRTQAALARYQRTEGIAVTGYLDTETMVRLDIHDRVLRPENPRAAQR